MTYNIYFSVFASKTVKYIDNTTIYLQILLLNIFITELNYFYYCSYLFSSEVNPGTLNKKSP